LIRLREIPYIILVHSVAAEGTELIFGLLSRVSLIRVMEREREREIEREREKERERERERSRE
jgi:hypothetical protein